MANARDAWPEEDMTALRELWPTGMSTAEIGRRLHRTKNSVVGRAHRLHLPRRPSPVRPKLDQALKERAVALVHAGSTQAQAARSVGIGANVVQQAVMAHARSCPRIASDEPDPPPPEPIPEPVPEPVVREPEPDPREYVFVARSPRVLRPVSACCWPGPVCDDAAERGKPYCPEHWKASHLPMPRVRAA